MVKISFNNDFHGDANSKSGEKVKIGEGGFMPYELLMSALCSCLYSTFIDIALKKRLSWNYLNMEAEYSKKNEVPAFLEKAIISVKIDGNKEDTLHFEKSFELASKYCSIYQTLSKVGDIEWKLEIEKKT